MLSIKVPSVGVADVVNICRSGGSMAGIEDVLPELTAAEIEFTLLMGSDRIWTMSPSRRGITDAVANDIRQAYTSRVASKRGAARAIYDVLRTAAPDGLCPNCMVRDAAALDHYLPKEVYPALALQPSNLVPICSHCNSVKLSLVASNVASQFLHPYFDELGGQSWLHAEVRERPTAPTVFSVRRLDTWSDVLYARMLFHFDRYNLAELYSIKSAALLGNHRVALESHYADALDGAGAAVVRDETRRLASSHRARGVAVWQAAAFAAWSDSEWFCSGGWRTPDDPVLDGAVGHLLFPERGR